MKTYAVLLTIACTIFAFLVSCNATDLNAKQSAPVRRALSVSPLNVAALVGSTVVLVCEVDMNPPASRVMWGEYILNSGGSIISDNNITLAHPNQARYMIIHNNPRQFNLEIRDIRMSDGGKYVCQDTLAGPPSVFRGEAELIVLGSNPNCTNTSPDDGNVIEGQKHTIECIITYQGGFAPIMTWTGPPPYITGGSPPNPTTVWSGVEYTVNRSMDTRAFQCLTNFTSLGELPDDVADNVPTWSYLYRAPQIFVFWGPKNMYVEPMRPAYAVGDVLTCYADANPDATYKWQNMLTLVTSDGQTYTITEDMVGLNTTLRCQAVNIIQGFIFSENLFIPAYVPPPTTTTTGAPTTTPTTPPLMSNCADLTGSWRSDNPYAELILEVVKDGQIGEVIGIYKNQTDTIWVEVVGTTRKTDFAYLGLSAIWPFDDGVTGTSGECHRCSGVEVLVTDHMWRSITDSAMCGDGGRPAPRQTYQFRRSGSLASALQKKTFNVWKPSSVSKRLGLNLKR